MCVCVAFKRQTIVSSIDRLIFNWKPAQQQQQQQQQQQPEQRMERGGEEENWKKNGNAELAKGTKWQNQKKKKRNRWNEWIKKKKRKIR